MASLGMQMLASALCLAGWAGAVVSCLMPMWKVTAFVGSTIVTSQTIWEGIWMTCVVQSTGQMSCKPYQSLLALGADLQAARALTVLAVVVGGVGLVLAFVGGKCTRFLDDVDDNSKGKVALAAGGLLVIAGVLCLVPTSWTAGAAVRKFYNAPNDAQRRELGACLYIGWGASILLILGGGLFIQSTCPLKPRDQKNRSVRYRAVRSSNASFPPHPPHSWVPPAKSQPIGGWQAPPHSQGGSSTKSPVHPKAGWEDAPEQNSEKSWDPSTKSQMKRMDSSRSEVSDAPSTKSQLERAGKEETSAAPSDTEDVSISISPVKTYL